MARIGKLNPMIRDAPIIAFLTAIVVIVAHLVDAFEIIASWSRQRKEWQAGELLTGNLSLVFALAVCAWRRPAELRRGGDERRRAEEALRASE